MHALTKLQYKTKTVSILKAIDYPYNDSKDGKKKDAAFKFMIDIEDTTQITISNTLHTS